jgi:hypothetical protein
MSLLDKLSDEKVWIDFYERKVDPAFFRISDAKELFQYVRQKRYLPVVEKIISGEELSIPMKKRIAKSGSSKKRVVYSLPEDETMVLKLLTWLMIRKYDSCLPSNLYSFRPHYGAKDALKKLVSMPDMSEYYSYKLDVRNYFNSIDIDLLLPHLKSLFADDEPLYDFIASQLSDPRAMDEGVLIEERKGAMAGMPYAVFLANAYLMQLDWKFSATPGLIYCRYSDDIIIFSKDKSLLDDAKKQLHDSLKEFHLDINHDKEVETAPGHKWTFLGFECDGKDIDVCEVSVQKLKAKMRRKSRALRRWAEVNGKDGWMAARAFIKHFNKKLYTCDDRSEINWSLWYFPLITTDKSLKIIDRYMQDCIRYLAIGKRAKSRFNFRYEQMKELGMISLINKWYHSRSACKELI